VFKCSDTNVVFQTAVFLPGEEIGAARLFAHETFMQAMTTNRTIPDRPRPGLPTTALTTIAQQGGSDKLATAVQTKIKLTKDICTIGDMECPHTEHNRKN